MLERIIDGVPLAFCGTTIHAACQSVKQLVHKESLVLCFVCVLVFVVFVVRVAGARIQQLCTMCGVCAVFSVCVCSRDEDRHYRCAPAHIKTQPTSPTQHGHAERDTPPHQLD